jgi:hypothetical protein
MKDPSDRQYINYLLSSWVPIYYHTDSPWNCVVARVKTTLARALVADTSILDPRL